MKKVLLAYSGGLDTSYCIPYLVNELGYEVHAVTVNTGGFDESSKEKLRENSIRLGASSYHMFDVTEIFYQECIRYLIFGNVLKNNTYPLSVSAERVFQAIKIAEFAIEIKADAIAHGSTGAGNDQVRFDTIFQSLYPNAEIITPIRDQKLSREYEIDYLKSNGFEFIDQQMQYSINKGLWGTSIGGQETLTSNLELPDEAYTPISKSEADSQEVKIDFLKGEPIALNGKKRNPVDLIHDLNELGLAYGVGRDVHVGDTIIGIKGRVGFEAPAALMLIKAHHLLEKHTLSKYQMTIKDQLSISYGNWVHEGMFLDPAVQDIHAFFESTQKRVTGEVILKLRPYRFTMVGVHSKFDLMTKAGGTYGEENSEWTGADVRGFSKIYSNSTKIYNSIKDE